LLGRNEEADYYLKQAAYYRNHNPYYHYILGQAAYRDGRYQDALSDLDKAIKLKKDEHQFYYLKGLTYQKLGSSDLALKSFKNAKDAAERIQLIAAYERKLEGLETQPGE